MSYNIIEDPQSEFKNYYNSGDRKFTFLQLEIRKLSAMDIFILVSYSLAVAGYFIVAELGPKLKFYGLFTIPFAVWILTITTPFGLRFRNVYFFFIWFTLCALFLMAGTSLSLLPIGCFFLYQLVRLLFWKRYNKEFIPFELTRAPVEFSKRAFQLTFNRVVSKTEGRGGYQEDKHYMKWLVRLGFCLFMACLFGIVGVRFR